MPSEARSLGQPKAQRRIYNLGMRSAAALCLLLGAWPALALDAERGVLAEFPFLDPFVHDGPLYPGHIRIDLSPRPRRPFPMLLDTGAVETVMTPLYARALGISVRSRLKSDYYRRSTILGRDLQFRVDVRSSETGSRTGFEYGLLGTNFLREYVIEVDYQKQRVRFLDPEVWSVSEENARPGEWILPMGFSDGRPTLEVDLGSGSAKFLMDTGAGNELTISSESAERLGVEVPESARRVRSGNVLGQAQALSFFLPTVGVGDHVVENVTLNVEQREGSSYRTTNLAGRDRAFLGNTFLSRFVVRFDYRNARVALLPRVSPPPPPQVLPYLPQLALNAPEPVFVPVDLSPARAPARFDQQVWLEVASPSEDALLESSLGWIDVNGWAGAGQPVEHDVVLVIDTSGSTAIASGADVDGDGKVGRASRRRREAWRSFNPARLSSDPDDTVLAAEILATRKLVQRLDPGSTRVGIVSFFHQARLIAPVGSDVPGLGRALSRLESTLAGGGTNMAAAIELATQALVVARPPDQPDREQSILLLSDGYPTAPENPEDEAYSAAQRAAEEGIRIFAFSLGVGELRPDDVFPQIAFVTGGQHVRVDAPAEIVYALSRISLTHIESIRVENLTTETQGRATRVFPDGSFDSLVRVQPGSNRIRIRALGDAGGRASLERTIHFQDQGEARPEELEAFREKLRTRTLEWQLGAAAARGPVEDLARELEIRVEDE